MARERAGSDWESTAVKASTTLQSLTIGKLISLEDVDQEDASGGKINFSLPLSETVGYPSRSSTLIDTPAQGILPKTLGQFCEWTTSIHPNDFILDAPAHDHDIARLPV